MSWREYVVEQASWDEGHAAPAVEYGKTMAADQALEQIREDLTDPRNVKQWESQHRDELRDYGVSMAEAHEAYVEEYLYRSERRLDHKDNPSPKSPDELRRLNRLTRAELTALADRDARRSPNAVHLASALAKMKDNPEPEFSYERWCTQLSEAAGVTGARIRYGSETHDAWRSGKSAMQFAREAARLARKGNPSDPPDILMDFRPGGLFPGDAVVVTEPGQDPWRGEVVWIDAQRAAVQGTVGIGKYRPPFIVPIDQVAKANPPREVRVQHVVAELKKPPLRTMKVINSPSDVAGAFSDYIGGQSNEVFLVLFIDVRNRVVGYVEFTEGSPVGVSIHPNGVFKEALLVNAAAFITAHQHPSGVSEPSNEDRALWKRLREAGGIVGVACLDNMVIGESNWYSEAMGGLAPYDRAEAK